MDPGPLHLPDAVYWYVEYRPDGQEAGNCQPGSLLYFRGRLCTLDSTTRLLNN